MTSVNGRPRSSSGTATRVDSDQPQATTDVIPVTEQIALTIRDDTMRTSTLDNSIFDQDCPWREPQAPSKKSSNVARVPRPCRYVALGDGCFQSSTRSRTAR